MLSRTDSELPYTRGHAAVVLLAAVLAYGGQLLLTPASFLDRTVATPSPAVSFHLGWLLLLAGGTLFALVVRRVDVERVRAPGTALAWASSPPLLNRRWRTRLRVLAFTIAIANCAAYAMWGESLATRVAWGVSIALFVSAGATGSSKAPAATDASGLSRRATALLLIALLSLAAGLRFVDLRDLPLAFHGDMAMMGLGARELLESDGSWFTAGWANIPAIGYGIEALGLRFISNDLLGLRAAAAIAGLATVVAVFALAALLFDRRIALLATSVAAGDYVLLHFSRLPAYIDPVPFLVLGFFWLLGGLFRASALNFSLAGVSLALACMMYYSGRISVLVAAAFLLYLFAAHRALFRARSRGVFLCVGAAALTFGPMLVYFAAHPHTLAARASEVFALRGPVLEHLMIKYGASSAWGVLAEQGWRTLLMFNYAIDTSGQYGFPHPFVGPWLAPALVLGTAAALARRGFADVFLLIWLTLGMVIGSVLTTDAPFWPRLVVLAPVAAFAVAVGVFNIGLALARVLNRGSTLAFVLALVVTIGTGALNWQLFVERGRTHVEPAEWLGRQIADSAPGTKYCMVQGPRYFAEEHIQFLARGYSIVDFPREQLDMFFERCLDEQRVWVIYRPDHNDVLARLKRVRPSARITAHDYPNGGAGPLFCQ